jgi:hypothetical protein
MYQGVQWHNRHVTFNNVQVLAKAAKLFGIPTIISTITKDTFSEPFMPEITTDSANVNSGKTQRRIKCSRLYLAPVAARH